MKIAIMLMVAVVSAAWLTGCQAIGPNEQQAQASVEAYKAFIAQQRSAQMIRIVGSDTAPARLVMEGAEVEVSMPLASLSAMGQDDTKARLIDGIASVLRMGLGVWGATEMAEQIGRSTVINQAAPATP